MDVKYDTIIIGAGPAGLAFANYALLSNPNEKILIIEKDNTIGGCHKVNRKKYSNEYYFCEHGPRIYLGNYVNFIEILKQMDLKFNDIFNKYNHSISSISNDIILNEQAFTFQEILILVKDFIIIIFSNTHGSNISMYNYMTDNNFTQKAISIVDFLCRKIDGGDSKKISLNQFLNSTIQSFLYSIYIPRIPNDEGLFNYWQMFLKHNNVHFKLNTSIDKIIKDENDKNKIIAVMTNKNEEIKANRFIFAIPPSNLTKIISDKNLEKYAKETEYNDYISLTFHWDYDLHLNPNTNDFITNTEWGLICMNMSEYMKFKESKSKTVISIALVLPDNKSLYSNKTAHECNDEKQLFEEVYQQLLKVYKNIAKPNLYFINNYYDKNEKKWKSNEKSYVKIPNMNYMDFKINNYSNAFTLGTHNGKHKNSFTSLESAVSNSIQLANVIYKKKYKIKRCFDLRDLIIVLLAFIIIVMLLSLIKI
jgi:protoporphyrinogen oxidase